MKVKNFLRCIIPSSLSLLLCVCLVAFAVAITPLEVSAEEAKTDSGHGDMGEVGKKLANPLASLWALNFNSFTPAFYDGDVNQGDSQLGATTIFQPVLPIPLFGEGEDQFRVIVRPVVPLVWSTPVPTGLDEFDDKSGIGDIQLPFVFAVPDSKAGKYILGAGPVFEFPTASDDALGADQWSAGPAVAVGHKGDKLTSVFFLNYFWKIGESGQDENTPDISKGTLLYSFQYALKDGWQVGTNPTISYNDRASSGNKWNVPVGVFVGKTMKIGKVPVNIKLGVEYSVVSPDDFGQQAAIRLQVTPIIPSLISKSLFGG